MGLHKENVQPSIMALLRLVLVLSMLLPVSAIAANVNPRPLAARKPKAHVTEGQHARCRIKHLARSRGVVHSRAVAARTYHRRHHYYEHFSASSFATDVTEGDVTTGEDPIVRQAALDALGNMNGTVAIEPTSGRILAMVNQKSRAFERGA